jgi:rhodanese-related sulfurtransferase
MNALPAVDLARWLETPGAQRPLLLDVREPWEVETAAIADSCAIPMHEIPGRLDEIPRDQPIVCICHHGVRSLQVAHYLARQGFGPLFNLTGGIDAWARDVDPACPTY